MTRTKKSDVARCVRCTVPGLRVECADHGHLFAVGDRVDLDAEAAPGLTWREALGAHIDSFEAVDGLAAEPSQE